MKFKILLIVILFTFFTQHSFAQAVTRMTYDNIIKLNILYVLLTGNEKEDKAINFALNNYWTVTPYKFIKADDKLIKDQMDFLHIDMYKGQIVIEKDIRVITIDNTDEVQRLNSGTCFSFYMPNDTGYEQALFLISKSIRFFNDNIAYYKKTKKIRTGEDLNSKSSIIKDKILLIPKEITEKRRWGRGLASYCTLDEDGLSGYRYKYKIVPLAKIDALLANSSNASDYCYLYYYIGNTPLYIFDCATDECLLEYDDWGGMSGLHIKKDNMSHISDIIDGVKKK